MRLDSHSSSYRRQLGLALAVALAAFLVPRLLVAGEPVHQKPFVQPYSLIKGTVWDPDGRPVYGVKVKIRRADQKKAHWELYSDHAGEFAQRFPRGKADYIVWAELKDYKLSNGRHLPAGTEVTVHIEDNEESDISLHLIW